MTREEYKQAMIPFWEEFQREQQAAWKLYATGFYNFRDKAKTAGDKYHRIAAEIWSLVIL